MPTDTTPAADYMTDAEAAAVELAAAERIAADDRRAAAIAEIRAILRAEVAR